MKNKFILLLATFLLNSCALAEISSINEKLYQYTIEAYYDYEINGELSDNNSNSPRLLYRLATRSGPCTLEVNLKDFGITDIIGGDKLTFYSKEEMYIKELYPGIICIPSDVKEIELIETPVYQFKVQASDNSLYCLDNNNSYPLTNKIIKNHQDLSLITNDEIYDSMLLFGTLNSNNDIDTMFTYNPRLINTKSHSQNFEAVQQATYTFIEKDNEIGTFINDKHLIKTNISTFDSLVIGNEYNIKTLTPISLINNYYNIEYLLKPISIELNNAFINDNTIDIKIYCVLNSYDGMPRVDENGHVDNSYIFMSASYQSVRFNYSFAISFNELCETTTLENSLYFTNENISIYSNYIGFNFINSNNKDSYLLDKDSKITEDIIIFINQQSMIVYM